MKRFFLVGGLAVALLSSCEKDKDQNDVNASDQSFMMQVSMGNKAEIMAGQLAASRGSSESVRAFGQLMVAEHGQAQSDLVTLGSNLGQNLPDSVDAEHQALMARLNSLEGYSFDTAYINSQVMDHQKTVDLFQMELNDGKHQSVRAYASQYLPHIQMHLQKADSISASL